MWRGVVPWPAPAAVPVVEITISLNKRVTSRLVSGCFSEALLLIDDPSEPQQVACVPAAGATSCPVLGVGGATGVNFRSGAVPNVFQGYSNGINSIVFRGVPVDPPGPNGVRTFRATNVRVNVNQLGLSSTLIPTQVTMFVAPLPPQSLLITNGSQQTAA